jgi:hypothetical protein
MKKVKKPYYSISTGFFDHAVRICFSDKAFQQAVKDSGITTKQTSLDVGLAESHYITQDGSKSALLAVVFNLEELKGESDLFKIGTIVHETVHTVTHMFQHVGEPDDKVGDETRAYFTEYLFKQIFEIFAIEENKRVGKENRKLSKQTGKGTKGSDVQVDIHSDGSARSVSDTQSTDILRGAQSGNGEAVRTTNPSI